MSLNPYVRRGPIKVYYHGCDLSKVKPEESLAQDWLRIGESLAVVIGKFETEDEPSIRR